MRQNRIVTSLGLHPISASFGRRRYEEPPGEPLESTRDMYDTQNIALHDMTRQVVVHI
jgi:hypothetical protein